jgi:hypothetical protein
VVRVDGLVGDAAEKRGAQGDEEHSSFHRERLQLPSGEPAVGNSPDRWQVSFLAMHVFPQGLPLLQFFDEPPPSQAIDKTATNRAAKSRFRISIPSRAG